MIKTLTIFFIVVATAVVAAWFGERPGLVKIDWLDYQIETSLAALSVAIILLVLVVLLIFRLWLLVRQSASAVAVRMRERKQERGMLALTRGMVALAAGDGNTARRFANQAENLLSDTQPLTMLLSAHSAQLQGDKRSAEKYFLSMLDLPEMEFLGLRGLILQAGKDSGERPLLLARRAFAINPRASWVISALYELEARAGNWSDAARTIENAIKKNVSDIDSAQRKLAIALLKQGHSAAEEDPASAASKLVAAHEMDPTLVPAGTAAAESFIIRRRLRRAARVIEKTWRLSPHPDLIGIYRRAYSTDGADRWLERISELVMAGALEHPEARIALAQSAVQAGKYSLAREQLEPLLEENAERRVVALMAEIEESQHGPVGARQWLEALEKAPLTNWTCSLCSHQQTAWDAHCEHCASFDSLQWRYAVAMRRELTYPNDEKVAHEDIFSRPSRDVTPLDTRSVQQ